MGGLWSAGPGLQGIREVGDGAGRLVGEGQRQAVIRQSVGQTVHILARLRFDAGEVVPFGFRLNDTQGLAIGVQ